MSANKRTSVIELPKGMSFEERLAAGKALRDACPRKAHAIWKAPAGRRDPVQLVLEAEKGRLPE